MTDKQKALSSSIKGMEEALEYYKRGGRAWRSIPSISGHGCYGYQVDEDLAEKALTAYRKARGEE